MIFTVLPLLYFGFVHIYAKVNAEVTQNTFKVLPSKSVQHFTTKFSSRSLIECADACMKSDNCTTTSYNNSNKQCVLSKETLSDLVDSAGDEVVTLLMVSTNQESSDRSHFGTSFMTGFMCNSKCEDNVLLNDGIPHLLLISTVPVTTNVSLTIPHLHIYDEHHSLNGFLHLQYPYILLPTEVNTVFSFGIEIVTDKPIALYQINKGEYSIDGTLEIPIDNWGHYYIVDTYNSSFYGKDQILVIAAFDNTEVTIELPSNYIKFIILNKFETYEFQADTLESLAGTFISASRPIAVHSGHECANIPDNSTEFCDHIITTIPPVNTLGHVFVVSYPSPRTNFSIGIAVPYNGTIIILSDINGSMFEEISANSQDSIFRSVYSPTAISITSNENILVTQYGHGGQGILGDPSLTIVPALKQFVNRCNFAVPSIFNSPIIVSVTIRAADNLTELLLNGMPVVITDSTSIIIPGEGDFNVVYIEVMSNVTYVLNHVKPVVKFGAILYGRNEREEYSTVLGLNL